MRPMTTTRRKPNTPEQNIVREQKIQKAKQRRDERLALLGVAGLHLATKDTQWRGQLVEFLKLRLAKRPKELRMYLDWLENCEGIQEYEARKGGTTPALRPKTTKRKV